ncbi:adenine deaminase [Salicibibacter kimchii]|uniref:adenine deaminase n=1 Tax=Salicibibacter kimchii TaxID=2099786 RepID=A0A345C2U9_9BACI|nr:adenine deaminase C-terminal domain-containing protein [Salicibibacter kimchii]AXF57530.1 adenine deaminase [Salicibibacter kimchii]
MHPSFSLWNKQSKRRQISVVRGEKPPTQVITNATYLNSGRKQWTKANIWIYHDRIVYVGDALPAKSPKINWYDARGQFIVPGYMEHHAHPFMLYHPRAFADYALKRGTSTIFNDNLILLMHLEKKKALSFISEMGEGPSSLYWASRVDAQTETNDENRLFTPQNIDDWVNHPLVVQGGEFSGWPRVIAGDDSILHWVEQLKKGNKPMEGHLPGASEKTLAQLALLGVMSDHEAITGEEVLRRLDAGYTTTLRHSSLRPDLPHLINELKEAGITDYSRFLLTTDGGSPTFYEPGVMDSLLKIVLEAGIDPLAAYEMVSYNVARHYGIEDMHGMIAPGRVAHLNFLMDVQDPTPISVMAKGEWIVQEGRVVNEPKPFDWGPYISEQQGISWDLVEEDMHFSMPMGIHLVNNVLLKPYHIDIEATKESLGEEHDQCFFAMVDKEGKWRMNTILKGFATELDGLATTFSISGDVIMIGKKKSAMKKAFEQLRAAGGGLFIENDREDRRFHLPLPYFGMMADLSMEEVMERHASFVEVMKASGYPYDDPLYSIFFFSSTHLPYVRTTAKGIYDVHKKSVLFPTIMR